MTTTLIDRHTASATTPEAALRLWFEAVYAFIAADTDREGALAAIAHMTIPLKKDGAGWERRASNGTFYERLRTQPHIFYSYAEGSTPTNGYARPGADFKLVIVKSAQDTQGRGWMIALRSSGADSPRQVYLRQSTQSGLWFVDNHNNLFVGVKPAQTGEQFI